MVNLRKVSAIATGALFVGATLGMAAAVTVPSDFKASMLADKGVAKAQLVVGKNAPGKVADTASAEIIQEAVKTKLAYTTPGGDIKISYGSKKWNDGQTSKWMNGTGGATGLTDIKTTNNSVDGYLINVTNPTKPGGCKYLCIDKNGDGDFKDTGDYDIYTGIYIVDGSAGTVQPFFNFSTALDSSYSRNKGTGNTQYYEVGATFKVKGKRYTISSESSSQEIKIAPTLRVSLTSTTQDIVATAVALDGTKKLNYKNESGSSKVLYLIDGNEIVQQLSISADTNGAKISDGSITADAFKGYKIWYKTSTDGNSVKVWAVRKDDEISLVDEQKDVLGFYQVRVNDSSFTGGHGLYFLDSPISLQLGKSVDIPGTEYYIKWDTDKTMKLRRKKTVTVSSGTKLDKNLEAYSAFLTEDVTMTLTGAGETKEPALEIVDEDTASSSMNHVLVGGPVANSLVANLVTAGKSKVDWYTSDGDIEVVSDAPASGFTSIIVAGKTRTETEAAAKALADAL